MNLKYLRLAFILEAESEVILPAYKGSALRGGFGNIFKKLTCVLKKETCQNCFLNNQCAYSYIFETQPPRMAKLMSMDKYDAVPRPFVIEPPKENKRIYQKKEQIKFNLVLIGRAIDYLPYFVLVFDELGRKGLGRRQGQFCLKEVRKGDELVYSDKTKKLKFIEPDSFDISENFDFDNNNIKEAYVALEFITPTRIKYQRDLVVKLDFHILIRNILRRLCLLNYFHETMREPAWDHKRIIEKAKEVRIEENSLRWLDWERYSGRQKITMKLGGLIGKIIYQGKIEPFYPLLNAGEIFHVGKGTVFGLGEFKILGEKSSHSNSSWEGKN